MRPNLNNQAQTLEFSFEPIDNHRLNNLCGRFDEHIRLLERLLNLRIANQSNVFRLQGPSQILGPAKTILSQLYEYTNSNQLLSKEKIEILLRSYQAKTLKPTPLNQGLGLSSLAPQRAKVQAKTHNQAQYLENLYNYELNFGIGPAGTGKTFLAVAAAVGALEQQEVKKIVLIRPVVEAGEHLGFLPGDFQQKIDPYLRPVMDALHDILGPHSLQKYLDKNLIELSALAYMRGRTLNRAFVILDEGQNASRAQMKMFLTRIGLQSKICVTGDLSQIDLKPQATSGLAEALNLLKDIRGIGICHFKTEDVQRHPLVKEIIAAYDT